MPCPSALGADRFEGPTVVDLRTPRATYDTFLRSIMRRRPDMLWRSVHPDLRFYLRRLYLREGEHLFFQRMTSDVACGGRTPRLGSPQEAGPGRLTCPVLQDGIPVGVAGFQVHDGTWLLSLLA